MKEPNQREPAISKIRGFEKIDESYREFLVQQHADHYIDVRISNETSFLDNIRMPYAAFAYLEKILMWIKERVNNIVLMIHYQGRKYCFYSSRPTGSSYQPLRLIEVQNLEMLSSVMDTFHRLTAQDRDEGIRENQIYADAGVLAEKAVLDLPESDSLDAVKHARRVFHHYILDSFGGLSGGWSRLGELMVKRDYSEKDAEGIFELNFAISEKDEPDFDERLPTVRYGFHEGENATIYAVQTPKFKDFSQKSASETIERYKVYVERYIALLDELRIFSPEKFAEICGEGFDKDIFLKDFERFNEWRQNIKPGIFNLAFDYKYNKGQDYGHYCQGCKEYFDACEALEQFTLMPEKLNRAKNYFGTELSARLRKGVPSGMLLSVCVALKLLADKGVKEIDIPLTLPFREKPWREANERLFNQMKKLIHRLVNETDGLELIQDVGDYPSTGNTTMRIKIGDEVSFKSQKLSELFALNND